MKSFSINIIFIVLSLIGIFFIKELPVSLNPISGENTITINFGFPGASPHTVEQEITSKLEQAAGTIEGLKDIKSRSASGGGSITCTFDKNTSVEFARFELASAVRRLFPGFPQGVSYPEISLNKVGDENKDRSFMIFSIYAPYDLNQIFDFTQNQIEPKLSTISEIEKVKTFGASPLYLKITYNYNLLKQYGINPQLINAKIQGHFKKESLGQVLVNKYQSYYFTIDNSESTFVEPKKIPLTNYYGKIIYLGEIAKIAYAEEKPQSYFRINGKNAINLAIYPEMNANELELAKQVDSKINSIRKNLPPGYRIVKNYDATKFIKEELQTISYRSIVTLAVLLAFVFLVSFSGRYLLVVLISFIANVFIAVIFYYLFKIQINLYSLAGITISLGLVVDNAIVMIEHYKTEKNRKVFLALLASTFTSIAALSSIFLLDDEIKTQLFDFAAIIIINLLVSLFIALFFIPALLQKIKIRVKNKKRQRKKLKLIAGFNKMYFKNIVFLQKHKKIVVLALILAFGLPVFLLPNKIYEKTWYAQVYNNTLGTDFFIDNLKPALNKTLGGTFRLFYYYVFDNMQFSEKEEVVLYVMTSSTKNHTIHHINEIYKSFETYLSRYSEIKSFHTQINSPLSAYIEIRFKPEYENSSFPFQLKSRLISLAADMDAFNWNVFGVGEGFSSHNSNQILQYAIAVYGYNFDELQNQIQKLTEKLKRHPRVQTVKQVSSRTWSRRQKPKEQVVEFNTFSLEDRQTSSAELFNNLHSLVQKVNPTGYLFDRGKYIPYKIVEEQAEEFDIWQLNNVPLSAKANIKINSVSDYVLREPQQDVVRENNEYKVIVELEYLGVRKFADKHITRVIEEMKTEMPPGYSLERIKDSYYYFKENEPKKYGLILLVFGLIFVLCSILFESFRQAFIVLSIAPLSFIGLFLAFYFFDIGFDQGGYAAFLLLSGITVNSVLYIINDFNTRKKESSKNQNRLYIKAFNKKIIPILLTVLSTILGLIPFLFFSENTVFWRALAVGSIGGLLASVLIVFFVLPVFFKSRNQLQ